MEFSTSQNLAHTGLQPNSAKTSDWLRPSTLALQLVLFTFRIPGTDPSSRLEFSLISVIQAILQSFWENLQHFHNIQYWTFGEKITITCTILDGW